MVTFKNFAPSKRKGAAYDVALADVTGAQNYEMTVSGSRELAQRVLSKVEFDVAIDPTVVAKDAESRSREFWTRRVSGVAAEQPPATIDAFKKGLPRPATAKNSLVISLHHVAGRGTWWGAWFHGVVLPAGTNLFLVLPPVCNCFGVVIPAVGDADIFLSLNSPVVAPVAFSVKAGTAIDSVAFGPSLCWPWTEFTPWFRINGFLNSVADVAISGFGVFP